MNKLKFIIILFVFTLLSGISYGQPSKRSGRLLPGRSKQEKSNVKIFRNPEKAIKKQAAKEKKMKKAYSLFIKRSRKRSIAIQSPEVQARMKQNQKNTKDYYKSRSKKRSAGVKRVKKKYRK